MVDKPPRFVELVRVSSLGQAARDTPQDQRHALDDLRTSRPGVLVERIDSAVSGATDSDDRADLTRLFALIEARAFEQLRIRHVDRITRHPDQRQRAAIFGALADAGIKVLEASGREIDPADEMGELDLTLQGWIASRERKRILERTAAGKKRGAAAGRIQGSPPYGRTWDKRAATWGEDRAEMEIYRRLFAECLDGRSLSQIAAGLNRDGIATPRGREWTPAHVSRLLRSRSATGRLEGWGHIYRVPIVVDDQTWRAVQARLKSGGQRSGPPGHHEALLRRVLRCGACGSTMWVQRGGRARVDVRTYYVCSTHRRTTDPDCRRYHAAADVDQAVRDALLAELRQPAILRAAGTQAQPQDAAGRARREADRATKELRDLDRQEERVARLMRRGLLSERVATQQLTEVARLRNAAEVERDAATARADAIERAAGEAHDLASRAQEIARRLERADFAAWVEFVRAQFPPPANWIKLYPDGRIQPHGLLSLGVLAASARSG